MLVCSTKTTLSFAIIRDLEPEKPTGRRTTYKMFGFYWVKKLFCLGYSIFYTANILENFQILVYFYGYLSPGALPYLIILLIQLQRWFLLSWYKDIFELWDWNMYRKQYLLSVTFRCIKKKTATTQTNCWTSLPSMQKMGHLCHTGGINAASWRWVQLCCMRERVLICPGLFDSGTVV